MISIVLKIYESYFDVNLIGNICFDILSFRNSLLNESNTAKVSSVVRNRKKGKIKHVLKRRKDVTVYKLCIWEGKGISNKIVQFVTYEYSPQSTPAS